MGNPGSSDNHNPHHDNATERALDGLVNELEDLLHGGPHASVPPRKGEMLADGDADGVMDAPNVPEIPLLDDLIAPGEFAEDSKEAFGDNSVSGSHAHHVLDRDQATPYQSLIKEVEDILEMRLGELMADAKATMMGEIKAHLETRLAEVLAGRRREPPKRSHGPSPSAQDTETSAAKRVGKDDFQSS
ncbi:MAG: hypothetical protein V3U60_06505 [Gammaproteobacteria bacterium]